MTNANAWSLVMRPEDGDAQAATFLVQALKEDLDTAVTATIADSTLIGMSSFGEHRLLMCFADKGFAVIREDAKTQKVVEGTVLRNINALQKYCWEQEDEEGLWEGITVKNPSNTEMIGLRIDRAFIAIDETDIEYNDYIGARH